MVMFSPSCSNREKRCTESHDALIFNHFPTELPQAGRSGRCSSYKPPNPVSPLQEPNKSHHSQMQERAQCCQFHQKGKVVPHQFYHLQTLSASLSSHIIINQNLPPAARPPQENNVTVSPACLLPSKLIHPFVRTLTNNAPKALPSLCF